MTQITDTLKAKMGKLLALADGNTNEHEAQVAMQKLHSLLAEHNMTIGEVVTEEGKGVGQDYFEFENSPWIRHLAQSIAMLYFCDTWYQTSKHNYTLKHKVRLYIVGTEINREYATAIIRNVAKTLNKEAHAGAKCSDGSTSWSFVTSFRLGAVSRISRRARRLIDDAKAGNLQTETGNAMVLADIYDRSMSDARDYMDNSRFTIKEDTERKSYITNTRGFEAGKAAGDKAQINTGINKGGSSSLARGAS